jgi:hypothetical protein
MHRIILTPKQEAYLRKHFGHTVNRELCSQLGVSRPTLDKLARERGLSKDAVYLASMRNNGLLKCLSPEGRQKSAEARRKTIRREHARITFGLPQRTKLRLVRQPHRKGYTKWYLRSRGYTLDKENGIAYYDAHTHRCPHIEQAGNEWFRFAEKPSEQEAEGGTEPPQDGDNDNTTNIHP